MKVLNRPTLVLNRSWQAINIVNAARAVLMLWNGIAKAVDPQTYQVFTWEDWSALRPEDGEHVIKAVSFNLRVPEVVTLNNYDKMPCNAVVFSRRNVFKRDKFTCQYCGAQPGSEELTIDHVEPRARGGETTWENCVLACYDCNRRKADRTLKEAGMRLRKQPKRPSWSPLYSLRTLPIQSWSKFISEAYWQVALENSQRDR